VVVHGGGLIGTAFTFDSQFNGGGNVNGTLSASVDAVNDDGNDDNGGIDDNDGDTCIPLLLVPLPQLTDGVNRGVAGKHGALDRPSPIRVFAYIPYHHIIYIIVGVI
jgi:hypothetical protein